MNILEKSQLVRNLSEFFRLIKSEQDPKLRVGELAELKRVDVLNQLDWEITRLEEAEKTFGVNSWSLLVGLAALAWAFVSLPAFDRLKLEEVLWAFILIDVSLMCLGAIWGYATIERSNFARGRTVRLSLFSGVGFAPELAVTCVRLLFLLLALLSCTGVIASEIRAAMVVILVLSVIAISTAIVLFRADFVVPLEKRSKSSCRWVDAFCGITGFILLIGPSFVLPAVTWAWAAMVGRVPGMESFRAAGILVAGGYLLRMLLISDARQKPRAVLERLRRDVALNFVTAEDAALELSWRLSGLPTSVYVNARLTALTDELNGAKERLEDNTKHAGAILTELSAVSGKEQFARLPSATERIGTLLEPRLASRLKNIAEYRATVFFSVFGSSAKLCPSFKHWEYACKEIANVSNDYIIARRQLDLLVESGRTSISEGVAVKDVGEE